MHCVMPGGCVTSFLLLVTPLCHLALKRAVWCLKIDPVAWPELIREEVFMVTPFRHKRLMGKLFIPHGDHGDSHFVGIRSMTLRRLPRRSFRQNPLAETPIIF